MENIIKIIAIFVVVAVLATFVYIMMGLLNKMGNDIKLESSVSAGEIVEKRIEKGHTGLFSGYVPVRYFFEVKWEYEKDGEVTVARKDFEVERDVYLAYDIGDYYDSQNFRFVSETENTEVEERDKGCKYVH